MLEIGGDGAVTVHDRPEVTLATGSTAIAAFRARRRGAGATRASAPPGPQVRTLVTAAADRSGLSAALVDAVARQESGLRPGLVSRAGALGEMQLMPATARALGVDPRVTAENLRGGALYLSALMKRYDGDLVRTLAAYNAGPGVVDRYGGVPPFRETRAYVAAVLDRLSRAAALGDVRR